MTYEEQLAIDKQSRAYNDKKVRQIVTLISTTLVVALSGGLGGCPAYNRYQARMDALNDVQISATKIQNTAQLVRVEQQRADIRRAEAKGIAAAQQIINATLTDRYLQHEAIEAQLKMANSPNHTQIYIPVGTNGIPLVKTIGPEGAN